MKLIKKNTKKGFTLIELVIVIAILAILALILVPTLGNFTKKANISKTESSARSLYTQAVLVKSGGGIESACLTEVNKGLVAPNAATCTYGAGELITVSFTDGTYTSSFNGTTMDTLPK